MKRTLAWMTSAAVAAALGACACPSTGAGSSAGMYKANLVNVHDCFPYWQDPRDDLNAMLKDLNGLDDANEGWALTAKQQQVYVALVELRDELARDLALYTTDCTAPWEPTGDDVDNYAQLVANADAVNLGLVRDGTNAFGYTYPHVPSYAIAGWANKPGKPGYNADAVASLKELQGRVRTALGSSMLVKSRSPSPPRPHLYYSHDR